MLTLRSPATVSETNVSAGAGSSPSAPSCRGSAPRVVFGLAAVATRRREQQPQVRRRRDDDNPGLGQDEQPVVWAGPRAWHGSAPLAEREARVVAPTKDAMRSRGRAVEGRAKVGGWQMMACDEHRRARVGRVRGADQQHVECRQHVEVRAAQQVVTLRQVAQHRSQSGADGRRARAVESHHQRHPRSLRRLPGLCRRLRHRARGRYARCLRRWRRRTPALFRGAPHLAGNLRRA
jgi:hypothetical protein